MNEGLATLLVALPFILGQGVGDGGLAYEYAAIALLKLKAILVLGNVAI